MNKQRENINKISILFYLLSHTQQVRLPSSCNKFRLGLQWIDNLLIKRNNIWSCRILYL